MGWFTGKSRISNKKNIKKKLKNSDENVSNKVLIGQIEVNSLRDFLTIKQQLLKGNIIIAQYKSWEKEARKDPGKNEQLRQFFLRIKEYCAQNNSHTIELEQGYLLITPNNKITIQTE